MGTALPDLLTGQYWSAGYNEGRLRRDGITSNCRKYVKIQESKETIDVLCRKIFRAINLCRRQMTHSAEKANSITVIDTCCIVFFGKREREPFFGGAASLIQ